MVWSDIQGWFDFDRLYREAVERAVDGAHFVEVGAWLGRSTAYMAGQIAKSGKRITFDAVDTWDGGSDTPVNARLRKELAKQQEPIFDQFLRNMHACGVQDHVRYVRANSAEAASIYPDASLDFVLIDGDHSEPMVKRDMEAYWSKIKLGCMMAGHDIGESEVACAVDAFCAENRVSYYREGNCWVIEKIHVEPTKILLGIPHPGHIATQTAVAGMIHPAAAPGVSVEVMPHQTSLLASGFNYLWASALERNFTHFAMLHSDIKPDRNWLDMLLSELQRTGADLISVVAPIKDERGLTSTGIAHPTIWYSPLRRLTMREVMGLPATFNAADVGYPDHALLINTGCWLADLRNPKWRETDAEGCLKIYFTIRDKIRKGKDDKLRCNAQSEDWFFSARMYENGLKAMATRKVQLGHYSNFPWPNYSPWGKWEHDNETAPHWNNGHKPKGADVVITAHQDEGRLQAAACS